ncbi:galactosyltransferase or LPS biosynthesis rfbu related protein [Pyrococcus sp. NA2]|uniref:glycosyltransferase family 4 protein n=1 Tax=Pyrococcus sp. (strain NA2) TaxID=342949 RepID=UPI000209ACDD|nr:glycosyltransferase family 4 protein [Pyrococcus sp. NA2]AEC52779.1 galactosyltransferase or LPS biosynthesis rfbu related protein [Pyrococcus sp. NA2]
MESLKIALVSDWYFPKIGGVAIHVHNLAIKLSELGHDVSIVTNDVLNGKEEELNKLNIGLVKIPGYVKNELNLSLLAKSFRFLVRYLRGFEVVHSQHAFTPLSLKAIPAGNQLGALTVVTNHSVELENSKVLNAISKMSYPYFKMYLDQVKLGIGVSKASANFLRNFTRAPVVEIPNGVNVNMFNGDGKEEAREKLNIKGKIVLYVGRLEPRKGVNYLIEAMKHVDGTLIVVGDGKMKEFLVRKVRSLGLEGKVKFYGFVPHDILVDLYKASDVFVLPSISEAFGIVLLEAMASETPIVGTSVGGIPEIVGKAGIIVPPRDPKALARAINLLLSDERLARKMGKEGRKRVERLYSWDKVAEKTVKLYRRGLNDYYPNV